MLRICICWMEYSRQAYQTLEKEIISSFYIKRHHPDGSKVCLSFNIYEKMTTSLETVAFQYE